MDVHASAARTSDHVVLAVRVACRQRRNAGVKPLPSSCLTTGCPAPRMVASLVCGHTTQLSLQWESKQGSPNLQVRLLEGSAHVRFDGNVCPR